MISGAVASGVNFVALFIGRIKAGCRVVAGWRTYGPMAYSKCTVSVFLSMPVALSVCVCVCVLSVGWGSGRLLPFIDRRWSSRHNVIVIVSTRHGGGILCCLVCVGSVFVWRDLERRRLRAWRQGLITDGPTPSPACGTAPVCTDSLFFFGPPCRSPWHTAYP